MKIDLHLHTKKCKQGDSSKRNISTSDFIKKMRENEVGICAITNHNHFDLNRYEEVIKEDPELVVFPGIELDVKKDSEHYHIIVISDPNERAFFKETFDNDSGRNYDLFYQEYDTFISNIRSFKPEDIIVIPHFLDKDKKRSLNKEKKDELLNDLEGYLVILEPGRLQTMGIINAHDELSLIGSDVTDWNKYHQYNIPEIKFNISSFKKFYELASNPKVFINTYLNETEKHLIPVKVGDKELRNNIDIYRDINIIFGEKGSGKTKLLKDFIFPHVKEKGYKLFLHEGKDYNEQYENMLRNFENSVEKDEGILNEIKKKFDDVINYNEPTPLNFINQFKRYHSNVNANKNAKLIKKANSKFSANPSESFESLLSNFRTDTEKIKKVKKLNEHVRQHTDDPNKDLLLEQLNFLQRDLTDILITNYKSLFINKNVELFLSELQNSIHKKTGKESKPPNIGFAKLVSDRLNRINKNNSLKQALDEIKSKKSRSLGYIPNKGEVILETCIEVLQPGESYNTRKIFERKNIRRDRSIVEKIFSFDSSNYREINGYFEVEEKILPSEFASAVIKKNSVIKIEGNNDYLPSEGEKAIITISGYLEDESYDFYLFDEIERGLGQKYITDYIIPKLKDLRDKGKVVVVSTHNSNIAINTLPSQTIYCDYRINSSNIYYFGNLYTNLLTGVDTTEQLNWKSKALLHLEGSEEMFGKRRNIYGI